MGEQRVNRDGINGHASIDLACLIGSRICHDLISPIGAISNGLELLDLAGGVSGPEMGLISDSVGHAGARIRFFRIAYGAAGDQVIGRSEIVSLLDDLAPGGRLRVDWTVPHAVPRAEVRLAFLALQCLETAMPMGGVATVARAPDTGSWSLEGRSERISIDSGLWRKLEQPGATSGITPALVQFALLPVAAADLGRRVETGIAPDRVSLTF